MLNLLADQNFNEDILKGLLRRNPELDIIRLRDVGLSNADDPTVLEWAAREKRILLTHDVKIITKFAYERLKGGKSMSGIIEVNFSVNIGDAVEDILLLAECTFEDEWEGKIEYLPLK